MCTSDLMSYCLSIPCSVNCNTPHPPSPHRTRLFKTLLQVNKPNWRRVLERHKWNKISQFNKHALSIAYPIKTKFWDCPHPPSTSSPVISTGASLTGLTEILLVTQPDWTLSTPPWWGGGDDCYFMFILQQTAQTYNL